MRIFDTFYEWLTELFIVNLVREIFEWRYIYKTTKANTEAIKEYGLRLDWLGRPYTVCNIPESVYQNEKGVEPYIIMQLRKYDAIFIKMNLTEVLYPEIERLVTDDTYAFIFLFTGKREYIRFNMILKYFLKYAFIGIILFFLIKVIIKNSHLITQFIDYINQYI